MDCAIRTLERDPSATGESIMRALVRSGLEPADALAQMFPKLAMANGNGPCLVINGGWMYYQPGFRIVSDVQWNRHLTDEHEDDDRVPPGYTLMECGWPGNPPKFLITVPDIWGLPILFQRLMDEGAG